MAAAKPPTRTAKTTPVPAAVAATSLERLPDTLRTQFLTAIRDDKSLGHVRALRQLGVTGTKGEIHTLLDRDEDLIDDAREAAGHTIGKLLAVEWEVALDKDHQGSDRARARLLRAYVPEFRESVAVTHGGGVEVQNTDVSSAIDRFTASVVQLVERRRAELPPGDAD